MAEKIDGAEPVVRKREGISRSLNRHFRWSDNRQRLAALEAVMEEDGVGSEHASYIPATIQRVETPIVGALRDELDLNFYIRE